MNHLEDRIRDILHSEAEAMAVPDVLPGQRSARVLPLHPAGRRPFRPARLAMAAAAVALVAAAGVVLSQRGDVDTPYAEAPTVPTAPRFHGETSTVSFDAASIEVVAAGRSWSPTADLVIQGDPGMPVDYTTLEMTWHDGDVEQRIFMYFTSDGTYWWADKISTYNGDVDGNWTEPDAEGEFFKSPLGTAFVGDVELPHLVIRDMHLEAFRRPSVCDSPTAAVALQPDYPVIDSIVGSFGASLQVIETATCTPLPVAPYTFEYVSDDPAIVGIANTDQFEGYPEAKTRVSLHLVAPGSTTVRASVLDESGTVIGTATMQVTVRPVPEGSLTVDTTVPADLVPPAASARPVTDTTLAGATAPTG